MGSTGDSPVPVGDSPTGRSRRLSAKGRSLLGSGAIPVPPGESQGGTGQWPTAIELSIETPSVGRPLPARNERGEGWGEGKSNKNATPLPGPLLRLRRKRGRRARSIPLIRCQSDEAPAQPLLRPSSAEREEGIRPRTVASPAATRATHPFLPRSYSQWSRPECPAP